MPLFTGKVIVVTGASSGIGRALCLALASQRPRLVLAARDAARLEDAAEACRAAGAETLCLPTDVSSQESCRELIARTGTELGGLDVLVNNAGQGMIANFAEVDDLSTYETLMRVNYLSCVYLTHAALPALRQSRGRIVVVSSLAGLAGVPTRTAYAASKHALFGFFDSLRIELAGTGVSVTMVAPDYVRSEIQRRAFGPDGRPLGESPLQESKIQTAEACAAMIVRAVERRERLLVTSFRGRAGRWLRLIAPGLVDWIALQAVRKGR